MTEDGRLRVEELAVRASGPTTVWLERPSSLLSGRNRVSWDEVHPSRRAALVALSAARRRLARASIEDALRYEIEVTVIEQATRSST